MNLMVFMHHGFHEAHLAGGCLSYAEHMWL